MSEYDSDTGGDGSDLGEVADLGEVVDSFDATPEWESIDTITKGDSTAKEHR